MRSLLLLVVFIAAEVSAAPLQDVVAHTGHIHALTIFAHFADEGGLGREVPSFAAEIFAGQPGSLTHFFREMSRGQFELTGEVLPRWYASRSNADVYVEAEGDYGRFAREIIQAADADVDFSRYDNDGPDGVPNSGDDDGYVDYIFIVSASAPSGFITEEATGRRPARVGYRLCEPRPRPARRLHPGPVEKRLRAAREDFRRGRGHHGPRVWALSGSARFVRPRI